MTKRIFNFGSGPAALPLSVLEQAQNELLNFQQSGMSITEVSHRSKYFDQVLANTEQGIRESFKVPNEYAILFLQGGASLQFAMIPYNLYVQGKPVDVIHTGMWTKKAIKELGLIAQYRLAGSTESENFLRLPHGKEIELDSKASYVHVCSNNTIFGTQWHEFPETGGDPGRCRVADWHHGVRRVGNSSRRSTGSVGGRDGIRRHVRGRVALVPDVSAPWRGERLAPGRHDLGTNASRYHLDL